jgi:spermidine/putrescine transport system permease protein
MAERKIFEGIMNKIRKNESLKAFLILSPSIFWLGLFFVFPLFIVLIYSFGTRGEFSGVRLTFTLINYIRFFDPLFLRTLMRSLGVGLMVTAICLLLGYPLSYYIAIHAGKWKNTLLVLVIIPFWTNYLIRIFTWILILRTEGILNTFLQYINVISEPLNILYTMNAVLIGISYDYLPFMILPLYASIEKLDLSLLEAAQDLGASKMKSFLKVTLPLTMPGIVAGSLLVFIPTIGEFVTPTLLGGARVRMIGNVIENMFLVARDWAFGSAAGIILMITVLLAVLVYFKFSGVSEE